MAMSDRVGRFCSGGQDRSRVVVSGLGGQIAALVATAAPGRGVRLRRAVGGDHERGDETRDVGDLRQGRDPLRVDEDGQELVAARRMPRT